MLSRSSPSKGEACLYTIGHSAHTLEKFFDLLKGHNIEVLADARSTPYSKYAPHFSTQTLVNVLPKLGVKYLFLGKELGGRPERAEFYDDEGHVLYYRLASAPEFLAGIKLLVKEFQNQRVALLCSEENPIHCHRRLLVGRVLARHGVVVKHIRGDGHLQTEDELTNEEARNQPNRGQISLFENSEETVWRSIQSVSQKGRRPSSSEY